MLANLKEGCRDPGRGRASVCALHLPLRRSTVFLSGSVLVSLLLAGLIGAVAALAHPLGTGHGGQDRFAADGGGGHPHHRVSPVLPVQTMETIVFRFQVTEPMVELSLSHPQGSGTLSLKATREDDVALVVRSADGVASTPVVITPRGVSVDNARGRPANYLLSVPRSVGSVRVRVGGRVVRTVSATTLRAAPQSVVVGLR